MVEILSRQLRSLTRIYLVMVGCAVSIFALTLLLGVSEEMQVHAEDRTYAEVGMAALALILLALIVPLTRRKLLDPERVLATDRQNLSKWGLPDGIDATVGRQAIYLTRYSAGCVIAWGLSLSVALYGLVTRILGSSAAVSGGFLAASLFVLLLLPPRGGSLRKIMGRF